MKKWKLIRAIVAGIGFSFFMLFVLGPKNQVFLLIPNQSGSYKEVNRGDDYLLKVTDVGHGTLNVEYEPKTDWIFVVFALSLGVIVGQMVYGGEQLPVIQNEFDPRLVTEHPRFAEFLKEDSDREFFRGDELVGAFSEWLSRRS